ADQLVPSILTDNNPLLLVFTRFVKFDSIITTTSSGKYVPILSKNSSTRIGKQPNNVSNNSKNGNKDKRKKYANCVDRPITSASPIRRVISFENRMIFCIFFPSLPFTKQHHFILKIYLQLIRLVPMC